MAPNTRVRVELIGAGARATDFDVVTIDSWCVDLSASLFADGSWVALLGEHDYLGRAPGIWDSQPVLESTETGWSWGARAGETYYLMAHSLQHGLVERRLELPVRGAPLELRLELPERGAPAVLGPEVSFPVGERQGGGWAVEIRAARSGFVIDALGVGDPGRDHLTLAPGRYLVSATCEPERGWRCGRMSRRGPVQRAPYAPVEVLVELSSGEARQLPLAFVRGERFEFVATVRGKLADSTARLASRLDGRAASSAAAGPMTIVAVDDELRRLFVEAGGTVELQDVDGSWRRLQLFRSPEAEVYGFPFFLPGETVVSRHPLPLGEHRLRFGLPGFQVIERQLRVQPGVTPALEIEFRP